MLTHKFKKRMLASGVSAKYGKFGKRNFLAASLASLVSVAKGQARSFYKNIICVWYIKQPLAVPNFPKSLLACGPQNFVKLARVPRQIE